MIGAGFMGAAHSQGWRVAPRFFDLPLAPEMSVLVGRDDARTETAADTWGWRESATDWREVIHRSDIDVVDIVTPGDSHAEIAIAALAAGKHVLCEKPLANTVDEARRMAEAAAAASASGIRSMVGFTYRRLPATTFARDLITAGRLGDIRQVRAEYLQDWLSDAEAPLTWRLQKDRAGSGALGDIGAHAVDLTEFMTGQRVVRVAGILETIVAQRPVLASASGLSGSAGTERGAVTVDDLALFTGRLESGALASFEASRFRLGRKNALRIEISGSLGSLSFDLESPNELQFYDATAPAAEQGFRRILVTEPEHPYVAAWWPTGHMLGYEHGFSHQAKDFVEAVAAGTAPTPSFADGLHVQEVLDAVARSSEGEGVWTGVDADLAAAPAADRAFAAS
ncbi:Gfo/Idh/MocA family protein [Microbacterium sp. SL75]|uniref:Gfo/Idh/MocA family protein n=1 Tax=Microbacterium sp. SL75 TaxID=2995140 RepID=UPI00226EEE7B|nr:Gfo/Idh/MocA family oxidoreductase [Microbacterium sp. SL75]WAC70653.1 Gfo/Idh/MocA family oxidoreductase [Microbacterium sp. SL75]